MKPGIGNAPSNFAFGKNGTNNFTMRKGESLRNYVKGDLPDNVMYIFQSFGWEEPGHRSGGYDTPLKAGAKTYGNVNLVVKVNYGYKDIGFMHKRLKARSVYVHERTSSNSPSIKESAVQYTDLKTTDRKSVV